MSIDLGHDVPDLAHRRPLQTVRIFVEAVGSEEDSSAVGQANWQFAKHFGPMFGYGIIHFKISNTKFRQTLTVNQTLNGPQFGFAIYF